MSESAQIIEEIQQITKQYHAEVGKGRKKWPNSIRHRIEKLYHLGHGGSEIASLVGISYFTVLKWRPKEVAVRRGRKSSKFHSLPVVASSKVATVTVTTPEGYQIALPSDIAVNFIQDGV